MAITQLTKTEFSEKIANLDSAISGWTGIPITLQKTIYS